MSPDFVKTIADRIHEDFSEAIQEIVSAAEEIREITSLGFNPYISDIMAPIFIDLETDKYYDISECIKNELSKQKGLSFHA